MGHKTIVLCTLNQSLVLVLSSISWNFCFTESVTPDPAPLLPVNTKPWPIQLSEPGKFLNMESLSLVKGKDGCVEPTYIKKPVDNLVSNKVEWRQYEALRLQDSLHGKLCSYYGIGVSVYACEV